MDDFNNTTLSMSTELFDNEDPINELSQLTPTPLNSSFEFESSTIPSNQLEDSTTPGPSIIEGSGSLWRLRSTPRRSWIWQHGDAVTDNGKRFWQCNLCKRNPKRYADGSTKHPIEHLKLHRMTETGPMEADTSTSIIRQAFGNSIPKIQFNADVFKQLLVQWI